MNRTVSLLLVAAALLSFPAPGRAQSGTVSLRAPASGANLPAGSDVTFSWAAVAGATSYQLDICNSSACDAAGVVASVTVTAPPHVRSLTAGAYWFMVTAVADSTSIAVSERRPFWVDDFCGGKFLTGDFDGNGSTDRMCSDGGLTRVSRSTPEGFEAPVVWLGQELSGKVLGGDFDGDGRTDVATYDLVPGKFYVAISTGQSFEPPAYWGTATATAGGGEAVYCRNTRQVSTGTADFNGDGRTDVHCSLSSYVNNQNVFVGLSTGSGFTFHIPGTSYCDAARTQGTLDFNGDGQSDWYCLGLTNGLMRVFPYVDGHFKASVTAATQSFCAVGRHVLGDFNADGRTDIACPTSGQVTLSTGTAYLHQGASGASCNQDGSQAFAADVDGDGASEIVCSKPGAANDDITVREWNGTSLGPEETWLGGFCSGTVSAGDFNADGQMDLLCDKIQAAVGGIPARRADLMIEATSSLGATTTVSYRPSTDFPNTPGSAVRFPTVPASGVQYVAVERTVDDGRGGESTWSYYYAGGKSDRAERRFLGFSYSRVVEPCLETEAACPFTETAYSQELASAGRPTGVYRSDGEGRLLTATLQTYSSDEGVVPRVSHLTQSDQYAWDDDGGYRHTATTYAYDAYGNRTRTVAWGDSAVSGDELRTDVSYAPNTSAYIVGLASQVEQRVPGGEALTGTRYAYDDASWSTPPSRGHVTAVEQRLDGGGYVNTRTMRYDALGNLERTTDATGVGVDTIWETESGFALFPKAIRNGLGEETRTVWDFGCGAPVGVTDPNDATTATSYDALCRPKRTDQPLQGWVERHYLDLGDPLTQRTRVETAGAPGAGGTDWSESLFDGLGRTYRTRRRGPGGPIAAETFYDARGAVRAATEPYGPGDPIRTTAYEYDALGRVSRVIAPGDRITETTWAVDSQTVTTPDGQDVVTRYDAWGRPTQTEQSLEGASVVTYSEYDALGRLVGMEDAVGNRWSWEYDALGRLLSEDDPDAGVWSYEYDLAGRLEQQIDAKGQVTTLDYDPAVGRLRTRTNTDGVVSYRYSERSGGGHANLGRLTTVTSPADVLEIDYDALGRPVRQARRIGDDTYVVQREYDGPSGALRSILYPDGDMVGPMAYDEAGRVASIPGIVDAASYDGAGRPLVQSNANSTRTSWTYAPSEGFVRNIVTEGNQGLVQRLSYGYDPAGMGMVTSVGSPVSGEKWSSLTYDDLYRLENAVNGHYPGESQSFTYDAVGRITSNSRLGSYAYPAVGQPRPHAPTLVGANALAYDRNGNLTDDGVRSYTWNADNLLARVDVNGTRTEFTYDGFGSRLVKTTEGGSTSLYPFGDDYEITDGVVTKYVAVEGLGVIAKRVGSGPGAETFWLHNDRLGSIQAATTTGGAVKFRRTYRPYGETLAEGGAPPESRGWIDQRNDPETGLTYLHARYYDPQLGIFLSPDPIGVAGGMNAYGYAYGDPVNLADRSGLEPNDLPLGPGGGLPWALWLAEWLQNHVGGDAEPCDMRDPQCQFLDSVGLIIHECGGFPDPCSEPAGGAESPKPPGPEDCPGGICIGTPAVIIPPEIGPVLIVPPGYVVDYPDTRPGALDVVPGVVVVAAGIAGSCLPGGGEAMDIYVLAAPDSSGLDRCLAAGSLGLNAATAGFLPNFGATGRFAAAARAAVRTHKHHTVPREILKLLPPRVAAHPLVRGRAGAPNRWRIPAGLHIEIHRGAGGGAYNEMFKARLRALGRQPTVADVLRIRDELVAAFGLGAYRP